jgi:hypothetical protein
MKQVFLVLAILAGLRCRAQDTIKVLFIGNSFMSFNDLPALFSQLTQGSSEHVALTSHIPGGVQGFRPIKQIVK